MARWHLGGIGSPSTGRRHDKGAPVSAERTNGLAYSTLACPGWSLERCVEAAREHGYDGLELRLVDGELIDPAMPEAERARIGRLLAGSGLGLGALDSSVRLTDPAPPPATAAALRVFLELAGGGGGPRGRG